DEAVRIGARLDEHHRRQIGEVPVRRDLNEVRLIPPHQRLHPVVCARRRVVDGGPGVAHSHVVRLEVAVHERVVVLDAPFEQQFVGDAAELPPGRDVAGGPAAGDLLDEGDALVQHLGLLLTAHRDRVFVRVAVHTDFVTGGNYGVDLFRECLDGVPGYEPSGPEIVAAEQLQQSG